MAPRTRDELLSYGVMDPAMAAVSPHLSVGLHPPAGLIPHRTGQDGIRLNNEAWRGRCAGPGAGTGAEPGTGAAAVGPVLRAERHPCV